jgi:hypothetical protein
MGNGHQKRTKKDVEDAYRRGFEAGFNVRPNPLLMILRRIWRKHELKKLKKAWRKEVQNKPLGRITQIEETPDGIVMRGEFDA